MVYYLLSVCSNLEVCYFCIAVMGGEWQRRYGMGGDSFTNVTLYSL